MKSAGERTFLGSGGYGFQNDDEEFDDAAPAALGLTVELWQPALTIIAENPSTKSRPHLRNTARHKFTALLLRAEVTD
jgi:hypothetical protein